jgi:hypothetical protein
MHALVAGHHVGCHLQRQEKGHALELSDRKRHAR